jgi:hypothetical protein
LYCFTCSYGLDEPLLFEIVQFAVYVLEIVRAEASGEVTLCARASGEIADDGGAEVHFEL